MLTYRIAPHSAPHKQANPRDYLRKEHILARQLDRCRFKENDVVSVKTNKGWKTGVVTCLHADPSKVTWRGGTQPYFIEVAIGVGKVTAPLKQVRS